MGAFQTEAAAAMVRPPGSRPERDFLTRCVRCGECMQACPSGCLQPAWLQSGFSGMFSPFLDPHSGGCRPECTVCGTVCPTGAIQALALEERQWVKTGTAVINREACLAWKESRRCMVCKENCPYGAIDVSVREGSSIPVPSVHENRCTGCGFCGHHCPKGTEAITVTPDHALRLNGTHYKAAALQAGLELDPSLHRGAGAEDTYGNQSLPPGFVE